MKILITGAKGFIGKNLISELRNRGYKNLFEYDIETSEELLEQYTKECDFVFHLAGVNRPKETEEFMEGNFGFTSTLLNHLKENNNKAPILITSSIQAELDNPYGESKKAGEELMREYGKECGTDVFIYRLPNVFGKWSRPNYNSVVATFCHNIAHDLPITINNPEALLELVYIDDVVDSFITKLKESPNKANDFESVSVTHTVTLQQLADYLYLFKESRNTLEVPDMAEPFVKKLYSMYLSFLPEDGFSYPLKMNVDERGSFTEFLKSPERGQVSINISKPGIVKGNHWHHTKNEKFLVVSGEGVIRFRALDSEEIIEYFVTGDKLEVVDIPVGYTHNIENTGSSDLVTVMWVNEVFDRDNPDTYFEEV